MRIAAPHEWDDEACCIHCGFDGAEHWWWSHDTYEGRAAPDEKRRLPPCVDPRTGLVRMLDAQRPGAALGGGGR